MEPARLREAYRERIRNHAARLGTYACDGCCEYTPDALRPSMMFCTACGCHRNFHLKVVLNNTTTNIRTGTGADIFRLKRRRKRTKFTAEQNARMGAFAARIGWKVRKQEVVGGEDEVSRFCREIGVTRQVFKIWVHNHKGSAAAATSTSNTTAAPADAEGERQGDGGKGEVRGSASVGEEK